MKLYNSKEITQAFIFDPISDFPSEDLSPVTILSWQESVRKYKEGKYKLVFWMQPWKLNKKSSIEKKNGAANGSKVKGINGKKVK